MRARSKAAAMHQQLAMSKERCTSAVLERSGSHKNVGFAVAMTMIALLATSRFLTNFSTSKPQHRHRWQHRSQQRLEYTRRAIADVVSYRPRDVLIMAHRGCVGRFPENTLAAIAACSEEGAHMVELDVERTADNQLVLMHDETLDRTTNRRQWIPSTNLAIRNLTLAQIQSPSIRLVLNENTRAVTNFAIPSFDEALQTAKRCGIHVYVDIKGRSYLEDLVVEAIQRADAFDYVLVAPFESYQPPAHVNARIQYLVGLKDPALLDTSSQSSKSNPQKENAAAWYVDSDSLGWDTHSLCRLRETTRRGHQWLWLNGEYAIRDPNRFNDSNTEEGSAWKRLLANQTFARPTHEPCVDTVNMEEPCLGAFLYQPLVTATCARILVTDLPGTVRAALLPSRQVAPMSVYPIEAYQGNDASDGAYHRLSRLPQCLAG